MPLRPINIFKDYLIVMCEIGKHYYLIVNKHVRAPGLDTIPQI